MRIPLHFRTAKCKKFSILPPPCCIYRPIESLWGYNMEHEGGSNKQYDMQHGDYMQHGGAI